MFKYDVGNVSLGSDLPEKIKDISIKVIRSRDEICRLCKEGFDIINYANTAQFMRNFEEQVNAGGILFCVFSGKDLVRTEWAAITEKAKNMMDTTPFDIDFRFEAYGGGSYTLPEYRGLGLSPYVKYYVFSYLAAMGVKTVKALILKDNRSSLMATRKTQGILYGELQEIHIFGWKSCKETIYHNK